MRSRPRLPAGSALIIGALVFSLFVVPPGAGAVEQLTLEDVQRVFAQAISRAVKKAPHAVIAVTDREGFVLGVWSVDGTPPGDLKIGAAVAEAGTAAYLSSDQNAFTSRTAQFIIQQNFPPGIDNRPTGPLVGVEFSNLPFSDVNRFKRLDPGPNGEVPGQPGGGFVNGSLGTGILNTRLNGRSGSAPLYKNGVLVGGVGSVSPALADAAELLREVLSVELPNAAAGKNADEKVALAGQVGFTPRSKIYASNVTIDGVGLPYVLGTGTLGNVRPLFDADGAPTVGQPVAGFSLHASPAPFPFPVERLGGQDVEVRFPIRADPLAGDIRGQPRLTEDEVRRIIARASDRARRTRAPRSASAYPDMRSTGTPGRARRTRAGIRLPAGRAMQVFITVVGNPDQDGRPAPVLGIARTPGATLFSFDVALQKARTAAFFSNDQRAFSTRTVGFLAQNHYPPGLNNRGAGPFGPEVFQLQNAETGDLDPATIGLQVTYSGGGAPAPFSNLPVFPPGDASPVAGLDGHVQTPPNPNLPNGITVFPGGFPLYRHGVLIGAIGISGDGIDQDDLVGASGAGDEFAPPDKIRADQLTYDGARLPYAKFPRNPDL